MLLLFLLPKSSAGYPPTPKPPGKIFCKMICLVASPEKSKGGPSPQHSRPNKTDDTRVPLNTPTYRATSPANKAYKRKDRQANNQTLEEVVMCIHRHTRTLNIHFFFLDTLKKPKSQSDPAGRVTENKVFGSPGGGGRAGLQKKYWRTKSLQILWWNT